MLAHSSDALVGYGAILESLGGEVSSPEGIADPDAFRNSRFHGGVYGYSGSSGKDSWDENGVVED